MKLVNKIGATIAAADTPQKQTYKSLESPSAPSSRNKIQT